MSRKKPLTISYQGRPGAYSHMAVMAMFKNAAPLPCDSFDAAFAAVETRRADLAMIPVDNTIAGRVADIHRLLPQSTLHIIGEHIQPIDHCLLAVAGAKLADIKTVYSHVHALPQCRDFIKRHKLKAVVYGDTGGSAEKVAAMNDKSVAAIASALAGKLYGLKTLKKNIADDRGNTTRFIVLARKPVLPPAHAKKPVLTSILFTVPHRPAALYKALGAFATHGVNVIKLESYLERGRFHAARFYIEVAAHVKSTALARALEELAFHTRAVRILGCYPADPARGD